MTRASERTYQAALLLARSVETDGRGIDASGNVSEGWTFTLIGEDGLDYNVEICAAKLSEEELREEGDL